MCFLFVSSALWAFLHSRVSPRAESGKAQLPTDCQVSSPPRGSTTSAARRWPLLLLPFGVTVPQCPCPLGPGLGCSFLDPKIYPKADTRWFCSLPAPFFFNVYFTAPGPSCGTVSIARQGLYLRRVDSELFVWDQVPQAGTQTGRPALGAQSLTNTREALRRQLCYHHVP